MPACGAQHHQKRGYHILLMIEYLCSSRQFHTYRWDMAVPEEKYTTPPPHGKARTLEALQANCMHSKKGCKYHLGSINALILPLSPTDMVLDELHALIRIIDVLLRNLIFLVDTMEECARMRDGRANVVMQHLEDMIKSCGVSFTIRQVNICRYSIFNLISPLSLLL